jgi:hypothetical protein
MDPFTNITNKPLIPKACGKKVAISDPMDKQRADYIFPIDAGDKLKQVYNDIGTFQIMDAHHDIASRNGKVGGVPDNIEEFLARDNTDMFLKNHHPDKESMKVSLISVNLAEVKNQSKKLYTIQGNKDLEDHVFNWKDVGGSFRNNNSETVLHVIKSDDTLLTENAMKVGKEGDPKISLHKCVVDDDDFPSKLIKMYNENAPANTELYTLADAGKWGGTQKWENDPRQNKIHDFITSSTVKDPHTWSQEGLYMDMPMMLTSVIQFGIDEANNLIFSVECEDFFPNDDIQIIQGGNKRTREVNSKNTNTTNQKKLKRDLYKRYLYSYGKFIVLKDDTYLTNITDELYKEMEYGIIKDVYLHKGLMISTTRLLTEKERREIQKDVAETILVAKTFKHIVTKLDELSNYEHYTERGIKFGIFNGHSSFFSPVNILEQSKFLSDELPQNKKYLLEHEKSMKDENAVNAFSIVKFTKDILPELYSHLLNLYKTISIDSVIRKQLRNAIIAIWSKMFKSKGDRDQLRHLEILNYTRWLLYKLSQKTHYSKEFIKLIEDIKDSPVHLNEFGYYLEELHKELCKTEGEANIDIKSLLSNAFSRYPNVCLVTLDRMLGTLALYDTFMIKKRVEDIYEPSDISILQPMVMYRVSSVGGSEKSYAVTKVEGNAKTSAIENGKMLRRSVIDLQKVLKGFEMDNGDNETHPVLKNLAKLNPQIMIKVLNQFQQKCEEFLGKYTFIKHKLESEESSIFEDLAGTTSQNKYVIDTLSKVQNNIDSLFTEWDNYSNIPNEMNKTKTNNKFLKKDGNDIVINGRSKNGRDYYTERIYPLLKDSLFLKDSLYTRLVSPLFMNSTDKPNPPRNIHSILRRIKDDIDVVLQISVNNKLPKKLFARQF